jgi:protoporphyrinogen oxidase
VDGYTLDHGFQVLLTAYSECQSILNYDALELGCYEPGALIWTGETNRFKTLVDPMRRPAKLLQVALSPVGSLGDKLRVVSLKNTLAKKSVPAIYEANESTTLDYLKAREFSYSMIEQFFKPFYAGIFLENELGTTSRMFEFVFKMFGQGYAALPKGGMQSIPAQMVQQLKTTTLQLNERVKALDNCSVTLSAGDIVCAKHLVVATDMSQAAALTKGDVEDRQWNSAQCYYFSAPSSPAPGKLIALNSSGKGSITNLSVPSDINTSYAPDGRALLCVSTDKGVAISTLEDELRSWFGRDADAFTFLKNYEVPHALPRQRPGDLLFGKAPLKNKHGLWICGDHRYASSLQAAMASGRMVGEAIANAK